MLLTTNNQPQTTNKKNAHNRRDTKKSTGA